MVSNQYGWSFLTPFNCLFVQIWHLSRIFWPHLFLHVCKNSRNEFHFIHNNKLSVSILWCSYGAPIDIFFTVDLCSGIINNEPLLSINREKRIICIKKIIEVWRQHLHKHEFPYSKSNKKNYILKRWHRAWYCCSDLFNVMNWMAWVKNHFYDWIDDYLRTSKRSVGWLIHRILTIKITWTCNTHYKKMHNQTNKNSIDTLSQTHLTIYLEAMQKLNDILNTLKYVAILRNSEV